jgi:uncharacterized membrane protein YkvA (DUF1232 family)
MDPRVPLALKLIPALAALYVAMPIDIGPDFIPILGQLDDVAILLIGLKAFTDLARRYETGPSAGAEPSTGPSVTATYRVRED